MSIYTTIQFDRDDLKCLQTTLRLTLAAADGFDEIDDTYVDRMMLLQYTITEALKKLEENTTC